MNIWQIILIAFWGLSYLAYLTQIGKPRKPITPKDAAIMLVVVVALCFMVVRA